MRAVREVTGVTVPWAMFTDSRKVHAVEFLPPDNRMIIVMQFKGSQSMQTTLQVPWASPFSSAGAVCTQTGGLRQRFCRGAERGRKSELTALCEEVDRKAEAQIAIVTVRSLDGEPIQDFSLELARDWARDWRIGSRQTDRGILILLAPSEHKYYTLVGRGLEGILPNGKVGGFGQEMVPLLRQNNYDGAVLLLTSRIAQVIAQDAGVTLTSPGLHEP